MIPLPGLLDLCCFLTVAGSSPFYVLFYVPDIFFFLDNYYYLLITHPVLRPSACWKHLSVLVATAMRLDPPGCTQNLLLKLCLALDSQSLYFSS